MSFIAGQRVRSATGGTISTITGYTVHVFSTPGSSSFVPTGSGTIEVLVVGGGGTSIVSGAGGGGGGGAVVYNRLANVTSGSPYPITVGSVSTPGGIGGISTARFNNVTITAFGGGAGGVSPGGSGVSSPNASGGGGGGPAGPASIGGVGAGVTGLGFPGATSTSAPGGGGGGAARAGGTLGGFSPNATGGIGVSYSITGISSFYGGGGGGVPGIPNGGPATAPLASFGTGNTPGAVIIRYPT